MKKVLLTSIIAAATFFMAANANAQYVSARFSIRNRMPVRQAFYYYPSANVYFNTISREYAYQRRDGVWISNRVLPDYFRIANTARFMVYHNGFDVWAENRAHIATYSRFARPEVVYHPYYSNANNGYYNNRYEHRDYNNCSR